MTVIVFDLDGTLIDSVPDLHAAALRMLDGAGLPPVTPAQTRRAIGNGVQMLVRRVMQDAGAPETMIDARHGVLVDRFLEFYAQEPALRTQPYPGAETALRLLAEAGHRLAVCTNKPEAPARQILDAFGFGGHFGTVIGGDTLAVRKPDPAPLFAAVTQSGGGDALFVGDSEVDGETAERAGMPFLLFTEGYRKSPIDAIPQSANFSSYRDLPGILHAHGALIA